MDKPPRNFWQIWNMSFGFLGIQFGWGLQMANMSAIYEYLGARADQIPILWLAAPLTGLIVQPIIKAKVSFDPFKSLAPVTLVASAPKMIVINPSVPAKDMKELIALLRANPNKYNYASPGYGTSPHLASERLFKLT